MATGPTPPSENVARLLDLDGAASYLHDTPRHVRSLWERRELTAVRIGRKIRFDPVDLDRSIDS
jgi:excisionase family DNA binding protein